jgi:hypothetical protein
MYYNTVNSQKFLIKIHFKSEQLWFTKYGYLNANVYKFQTKPHIHWHVWSNHTLQFHFSHSLDPRYQMPPPRLGILIFHCLPFPASFLNVSVWDFICEGQIQIACGRVTWDRGGNFVSRRHGDALNLASLSIKFPLNFMEVCKYLVFWYITHSEVLEKQNLLLYLPARWSLWPVFEEQCPCDFCSGIKMHFTTSNKGSEVLRMVGQAQTAGPKILFGQMGGFLSPGTVGVDRCCEGNVEHSQIDSCYSVTT